MGRWKAPLPASSPYITRSGFETLQQELKDLWLRRRDVVKALAAAAAEGDRSENAEYIYRKKELGSIDYRIRYLQKRLPKIKVVDSQQKQDQQEQDKIFFGAWVTLMQNDGEDDGKEVEYRIVGPDETDAKQNFISMDSPMAKALMRKQVDDEVTVKIGDSSSLFEVIRIRYE